MGALAQLQSQAKTFSTTSPLARWLKSEIARLAGADADIASAAAVANAVHQLNQDAVNTTGGDFTLTVNLQDGQTFTTGTIAHNLNAGTLGGVLDSVHIIGTDATDHTGGDFTLTVELFNGETFTTAAIAFDATAAETETAIDVAATAAAITGWVNGHISVAASGIDLQDGTLTLTFDGASVDTDTSHVLTTMADSRTGGVSPTPTITNATAGIEAKVNDAAAAASITGWRFGDIRFGGTSLQIDDITLTYSGSLWAGIQQPITVFNDSRTGGTPADPLVTITTPGQTERAALSILLNYGIITGAVAAQNAANIFGTGFTKGDPAASRVPAVVVKALMAEAAAEDENNSTYHAIEEALYGAGNDRANSVELRVPSDD